MVLATVKDPDDDNFGTPHLENDRCPAFESHGAKALANIVAFRTSFGKDLQSHAGRFDPIDIDTEDGR